MYLYILIHATSFCHIDGYYLYFVRVEVPVVDHDGVFDRGVVVQPRQEVFALPIGIASLPVAVAPDEVGSVLVDNVYKWVWGEDSGPREGGRISTCKEYITQTNKR